ncbi:MAG: hypothetical protein AAGG46_04125, partial [Planctomycetota bacterium]
IDLFFEQQSLDGASVEYAVDVMAFGLFFGATRADLTAPDGTVFDDRNRSVTGLDFQQLADRFFGDWTISAFDFTTGGTTTHIFALSPFTPDDVLSEVPTIDSPVPSGGQTTIAAQGGAANFNLAWSFPSAVVPSRSIVRTSLPIGGSSSVDFNSGSNIALISTVLDPGVLSADFVYRAGTIDSLNDFVTPAVSDDPAVSIVYSVGAEFRNLSQPITVTVAVPEPSSLVLAALTAAGALALVTRSALGKRAWDNDVCSKREPAGYAASIR